MSSSARSLRLETFSIQPALAMAFSGNRAQSSSHEAGKRLRYQDLVA